MSRPQDRNSNSNSVLFDRYECHCVNYFWLHKQWIRDFLWMCQYLKRKASLITLTSTYSKVHYAFVVKWLRAVFLAFVVCPDWSWPLLKTRSGTVWWLHFPSALCRDNLTFICPPSPNRLFVISQILGDTWPDPTRFSRQVGERTWERG